MEHKLKLQNKTKLIGIIGLAIVPILLSSCETTTPQGGTVFCFSSFVDVNYLGHNNNLFNKLRNKYLSLSGLFDAYEEPSSDTHTIYSLNHGLFSGDYDENISNVLLFAEQFKTITNGYFNPLCFDLANLWKDYLENDRDFPSEEEISVLKEKMDNSYIQINENQISLLGEAHIDVGGIAKGYALETSIDDIFEEEVTDYIINAGSSSILLGRKNSEDGYYTVGIKNTNGKYLKASYTSIGTSSIYEQGFKEHNGKKYSHIVNPLTGYSEVVHDICVVMGPSPIYSDVLATVGVVMSLEDIINLESLVTAYKFICFKDGEVVHGNELVQSH